MLAQSPGGVLVSVPRPRHAAAFAGLAFVAVLCACPPVDDFDVEQPVVVSVEPATPVVPVSATFRIGFSEAMLADSFDADPASETLSVALVRRDDLSDAFLSDFDNPPISESRTASLVALDVGVDDDDTVLTLSPRALLQANTAYVILLSTEVRDANSNPIANARGDRAMFVYDFNTDAGAPSVAATDFVSASAPLVLPNRKRVTVTFNQPVSGVDAASLFIEGTPAVPVEAVLLDATRTQATLILGNPSSGCARLGADRAYALVVTSGVTGDNGQTLVPYREEARTAPSCDLSGNSVVGAPVALAGDVAATLRFDTTKASTTRVRFGRSGQSLDCLGGPCPLDGAAARAPVAGAVPVRYAHAVELGGLTVGVMYAYTVLAEDDTGFVATSSGTFTTAPLPDIAINELMANPPAGAPEPGDEYIELTNYGTTAIALLGFTLDMDGGDVGGGKSCALPEYTLAAGAHVALVGRDFSGATYGGVDESRLIRSTLSSFCGALRNSSPNLVILKDGSGRPVSSMTAYDALVPHDEGRSVERAQPAAADVAASYCRSRQDTGPTPGAENGTTRLGCDA